MQEQEEKIKIRYEDLKDGTIEEAGPYYGKSLI